MRRALSVLGLLLILIPILAPAGRAQVLVSEDLGRRAYMASGFFRFYTPDLAFDGDLRDRLSYWNSGDYAPQWIEVDLQQVYNVFAVDLVVNQLPDGETVHEVWVSTEPIHDDTTRAARLYTFEGYTRDRETIGHRFTASFPARYVQIRTVRSPSWVAWMEVQVYAAAPE
jgi:hypothetical protein